MSEPTESMAQGKTANPSEDSPETHGTTSESPQADLSPRDPDTSTSSDAGPAKAEAAAPAISEAASAEMAAAMDAAMTQPEEPKGGGKKRSGFRGPRVVQGGREHRTGTVVSVNATTKDVFLEFGPKELGLVEGTQFKGDKPVPAKGEEFEVVVERFDPTESLFHCVLPGSVQKADWEMLQKGQTIEARVTGAVKGGLELEVAGHRAFMPASQVSLDHIDDFSGFIGEKMVCQVDRLDRRGKGNIVLSRRNLLREERERQGEKLKETLAVGQTIEGTARKIMPFGVFVDIGGIDGLVHVSDLSHERIYSSEKAIAQHVKEGQKLTVQILKLDWDEKRIALGVKQLQADPFEAAASEVVEGATLTGRVKNLADFGAFIEVAKGVEGLVHISELDWKRVNHPSDVLKADEVVQVKVLSVDPETKKISLSIKQLKDAPKAPAGGGRGGPGGGGRGKGRGGRGERDDRDPAEILKETPEFRRLREQAKKAEKKSARTSDGGLGSALGEGLGNLKL